VFIESLLGITWRTILFRDGGKGLRDGKGLKEGGVGLGDGNGE
jgi:hypothetical protein